jgi:16S rRNA (cytosine967-C5)-methyltransferase|nr:RsmB/NOP family class I SAM-dependent RNA methyltransferase [Kofleriaceae bacterium]
MTDQQLAEAVAQGGRLRALVLELWQRTRMDWGFVTDRLAQAFRRETWVGSHERRFVGEVVYGLVRHLRRVDLAVARGRKTKQSPRDLERLLALLVIEKMLPAERAARVVPDLDWRAVAGVDDAIAGERDTTARIALQTSLPDWLAKRLVADWGDQADALARSLNQRAPMTVRANLLVGDRDALALSLDGAGLATRAGAWSDTALVIETRTNLFGLDAFKRGALEAQDEGSQLLADLVVACAGDRAKPTIVDYCAGAGGKTLAIAARLHNRGRIIATDVDGKKLEELRRRARRATVSNARAMTIEDGRWPGKSGDRRTRSSAAGGAQVDDVDSLRGKADVVFVDAPCSGVGALRRNPEARWRLREDDITTFAARQREILSAARELCAPGARLVYATCSLLRAENDDVVAGMPFVKLSEVWGSRATALGDGDSLVVAPHTHNTDGFYARVLQT